MILSFSRLVPSVYAKRPLFWSAVLLLTVSLFSCGCTKQSNDRRALAAAYTEVWGPEKSAAMMQEHDKKTQGKSAAFQGPYWSGERHTAEIALGKARRSKSTYAQVQASEAGAIQRNGSVTMEKLCQLSLNPPRAFQTNIGIGKTPKRIPFIFDDHSKTRKGIASVCLYLTDDKSVKNWGAEITLDKPFSTQEDALSQMGLTTKDVSFADHGSYRNYRLKTLGTKGQFFISMEQQKIYVNWSGS